jgi:hypothetical protein
MSQNNAARSLPYDHAAVLARLAAQLVQNTAGSGATSGSKFYAWTQLQVYGVTFATVTAGTSTYTVAGTATAQAQQLFAIYITNTSTTGGVSLSTSTVGPFTVGGTATAGANVAVGGVGGVAGGYQGPYALNTIGGTNTSQVWGTNTFLLANGVPGAPGAGYGGLPMNPGDVLYFVNGTDATSVIIPIIQYGVQPVNGQVVA